MSFKERLKEYFTFTKGESMGITVLLILLFIAVIINLSSEYLFQNTEYDFSKYKELLSEFDTDTVIAGNEKKQNIYENLKLSEFNPNTLSFGQAEQLGLSEYQYKMIQKYLNSGGYFNFKEDFAKIYSISKEQFEALKPYIDLPEKGNKPETDKIDDFSASETNHYISYFSFDPNTLDDSGWQQLGFSEKQIISIRKYISAGGKFYKKADLKKLYVISEKKYTELEPYINIHEKEKNFKKDISEKHPVVDINNLSADEMKKYGKFWQYNATRIVKYRNLLGGYYKKEQLLEVYGVKKEYFDKVADDIVIDKTKLEKINVNFAEVSELGRHPYISYEEAKKILDYRNKNGPFKQVEDLINKKIISKELYNRIGPYLKVR